MEVAEKLILRCLSFFSFFWLPLDALVQRGRNDLINLMYYYQTNNKTKVFFCFYVVTKKRDRKSSSLKAKKESQRRRRRKPSGNLESFFVRDGRSGSRGHLHLKETSAHSLKSPILSTGHLMVKEYSFLVLLFQWMAFCSRPPNRPLTFFKHLRLVKQ